MTEPLTLSTSCSLDSPDITPVVRIAGRWLSRVTPGTETAETVTRFVKRRFAQAYGAEPALRIPGLMALTTGQGSLLAAVGVRNAACERLFLEDYLPLPVEALLPRPGPDRARIAEIAHLAGVEAGVSRYLFASLAVWLAAQRYEWVVCTGTAQLRNSFQRLGITTESLGRADPKRLADGGAGWGSYYEHQPVVMAIDVTAALAVLTRSGLLRHVQMVDAGLPAIGGGASYERIA